MNSSDKSGKRNVHSTQPESDRTDHSTDEVDCPRCGGRWYEDLEPGSNLPYTCFYCCNGTLRITRAMVEAEDMRPEYDAGQRACMAELAGYEGDYGRD